MLIPVDTKYICNLFKIKLVLLLFNFKFLSKFVIVSSKIFQIHYKNLWFISIE